MNTKILKIEMLALFSLTMVSILSYYFGEGLGDHAFMVTSDTPTVSFFGYYLSSLIQYIGYFTGPWLMASSAAFVLSYVVFYSRRDFWQDSLLIVPTIFLPLSFCYFFFPQWIGEGLFVTMGQIIGGLIIFLIFFSSIIGLAAGIMREKFFIMVKEGSVALWNCREMIERAKKQRSSTDMTAKYRKNPNVLLALQNRFEHWKDLITAKLNKAKFDRASTSSDEVSYQKDFSLNDLGSQRIIVHEDVNVKDEHDEHDENLEPARMRDPEFEEFHQEISESVDAFEMQQEPAERHGQAEIVEDSGFSVMKAQIERKLEGARKKPDQDYKEIVSCFKVESTQPRVHIPDQYFGEIIKILEGKLAEFDILGRIVNILKGPVVDTFELELGPGIPVTKVSNRSDDLSLALKGVPVRIVYPMEGKTTIGIEVPRDPREIIFLHQIIRDQAFEDDRKALPIVMGLDAFGEVYITDLTDMPHMLVAGATKSGKSVFINTMLISLLVKKTPRDLRLILVDPKHVELSIYKELPHLAMPVITDPKMAAISLLWAVEEMERRYAILTHFKVRNIESFHRRLESASVEEISEIHKFYEGQLEEDGYHLPYIVIIIDEFADLILTKSGKEIEIYVNRLAAKARAAGIHLVVATQRPSVKVITGNIKSNFPSRVAFQVMSGIDSRTILDSQGAEKLLGKGDMLFSSGVTVKRAHSAYVSDAQVGEFVKNLNKMRSSFLPTAMQFLENGGEEPEEEGAIENLGSGVSGKLDDRYEEAMELARQEGVVSASMLQRKMGIGYPKAAKIVDQMEKNGMIGPARGSKPREVL